MAIFPMGAGQGLMSCPAGSGLLPGLHTKSVAVAGGGGGGGAKVLGVALESPRGAAFGAGKTAAAKVLAGGCGAKGLSLGLGIGLGLWGPVILAGLGAAAAYSLWRSRATVDALTDETIEMNEALADR